VICDLAGVRSVLDGNCVQLSVVSGNFLARVSQPDHEGAIKKLFLKNN